MEKMKEFNFIRHLDYAELAEIDKNPSYLDQLVKEAKMSLMEEIVNNTENKTEYDKVFRFHIIYEESCGAVLGKIEQIPIMETVIKFPEPEKTYVNPEHRLKWRDRLKILLKGRI